MICNEKSITIETAAEAIKFLVENPQIYNQLQEKYKQYEKELTKE